MSTRTKSPKRGGQVVGVGFNAFPSSKHVACMSFFSHIIFSMQDGNKICLLFHLNKNQHKDDHEKGEHEDEHKESEQKYEHKNEHTRSIESYMVEEGDIVISIWD